MRFKAPLTNEALQAIQDRTPRRRGDQQADDLYAALWEINRLLAMVLRAGQLQRAYGGSVFGEDWPELSAGPRMAPGGDLDGSRE